MARRVARGDVWLYRFGEPDKRRPVVVISRDSAIQAMHSVLVAPITSTRRGLPSEVPLDSSDGMKADCVVNLDNVQSVPKRDLERYVATLRPLRLAALCEALAVAAGCD